MLIKMCLMTGFDTPMCMLSLHQEGCSTFVGGNQLETLTHTYQQKQNLNLKWLNTEYL